MHALTPAPVGGLETVVQTLSAAQARLGDEVHVAIVVDDVTSGLAWRSLAAAGVHVHEIIAARRRYAHERSRLRGVISSAAPDVVHTHGYHSDVLHSGLVTSFGIPLISTVHGFTGGDFKNRLYEWLQRRSLRNHNAVIAVSEKLAGELRRYLEPGRVRVIRNAWAPQAPSLPREQARQLLGCDRSAFLIGWIGRLSHEKGADLFLAALQRVGDLPVRASIIGDGGEAARLRRLAKELCLADRIQWHGIVPEASRLLRAFDVVVLSSRREGTPMVVYEALHAGVPLIAADVGGVGEIVSSREASLVRPDDPGAIAEAIRHVFQDRSGARQRAAVGHKRLTGEFGVDQWVARHNAVYRSVERSHI